MVHPIRLFPSLSGLYVVGWGENYIVCEADFLVPSSIVGFPELGYDTGGFGLISIVGLLVIDVGSDDGYCLSYLEVFYQGDPTGSVYLGSGKDATISLWSDHVREVFQRCFKQ